MTDPAPELPVQRIQSVLDEVIAACRRASRDDLLTRLKAEAEQLRPQLPTVVVVGEVKRGKSSLINAILGSPGLSPVDVDVATGCQVFFHFAPTAAANIQIGTDEPTPIALEDLPDWVTVDANPNNHKGISAAYVGLPVPLLKHFTLVDTPGVGGLEGVHGELALQTAAQADLLVFAVESSGALSQPELHFLGRAADRVQNLVFVMTKTDVNSGWRQVMAEDQGLLREHAPRFADAPMLAVSSRLALAARDEDGTVDEELGAESGIPELTQQLADRVAGRAQHLRVANLLRLAQTTLSELFTSAQTQLIAVDDTNSTEALINEQRRLEQLQSSGSTWPRLLEDGLRRIALDRADQLSRGMRDLRVRYDTDLGQMRGEQLDQVPEQLLLEVTQLATQLAERTGERVDRLASELASELAATKDDIVSIKQLSVGETDNDITLPVPSSRKATRLEKLSTAVSFSSGRSIGSLLAGLPILALGGIAFTVIGGGIGGLFAWQMHRGRSDLNRQAELRSWMREQLAEAERQLNNDFSRRMIDVQNELRQALSSWLSARMTQVAEALKVHRAAIAADQATREKMRNAARVEVERLAGADDALEKLQYELQGEPFADATQDVTHA